MGSNSRRRREARDRRARAGHAGGSDPSGSDPFGLRGRGERSRQAPDPQLLELVGGELGLAISLQRVVPATGEELEQRVESMLTRCLPATSSLVGRLQADMVTGRLGEVLAGGWSVADVAQAGRRAGGSGPRWLATAVVRLHRQSTRVADRGDLAAVTAWEAYDEGVWGETPVIADAVALLALLDRLPLLDARTFAQQAAPRPSTPAHPKLLQVRALLAKAESTEFGPEAEALMAKAQALISTYALERLVDDPDDEATSRLGVRRVWLDRPYLAAKAALVGEVARANRCRSAFGEDLGFSVVVGEQCDLDAVELLVTSLLVQADTAMSVHGRRSAHGRSRSFRQSFLMAYATRIGERLRAADEEEVTGSGLLPVLRQREEHVDQTFHAMVATRAGRSVRVSDADGWRAGTAAADLSRLDARTRLPG